MTSELLLGTFLDLHMGSRALFSLLILAYFWTVAPLKPGIPPESKKAEFEEERIN